MKVTPEHLEVLRAVVVPLDTPERREAYRAGDFPRSDAVKDLDKRYRWDLFWAGYNATKVDGLSVVAHYNDAHIDTALRAIVPDNL